MYPAVEVQKSLTTGPKEVHHSPILFHHFKDACTCVLFVLPWRSCWVLTSFSLKNLIRKDFSSNVTLFANPSLIITPCLQMDLTALSFFLGTSLPSLTEWTILYSYRRKYSSLWVQGTKCERNLSSWVFTQTTFF